MDLKSRVEFMDFAMESQGQHLYDERTHAMACIGIQEICLNKSNHIIAEKDDVLQMILDFALS
jgi:hypothetical protein